MRRVESQSQAGDAVLAERNGLMPYEYSARAHNLRGVNATLLPNHTMPSALTACMA